LALLDFTFSEAYHSHAMATVRELVSAIRERPGIDAAVVVGRDGLVIAADVAPRLDPDDIAASVPPLINAADAIAGPTITAAIEHRNGHLVLTVLPGDAVLVVLARPGAELAPLVHDLRRYRERIAELV
jgi:predicted regulator of Ras-like GTPase activity (Roadblock/LC7/MglB family)